MPIYEYKCKKCSEKYEALVLRRDEAVPCPCCNSADVEKLMSAFAFKSGGNFTPSSGSSACGTCSGGNCSTCH